MKPREWQSRALRAWEYSNFRGIVGVVTGGGKTVFAGLCMKRFLEIFTTPRILVLVPSISLLDQWTVSLQEDVGFSEEDIAAWSGRNKPSKAKLINVMVMNTGRSRAADVALTSTQNFVIVDECHRVATESNARALAGHFAATLGMSATPRREFDSGFEDILLPALGPVIFEYGLADASRDGIVSKFNLVNVEVPLTDHEEAEYRRLTRRVIARLRRNDGVADEALEALLRKRARVSALASMRAPTAVRLVDLNRGVRSIVFHESIGEAEKILKMLVEGGHSATIYHSKLGDSVRRDNLRLYRRGIFDTLISCRALDEGINIPETQIAVVASATSSNRQRIQRLGRVLRPAKGKDAATVFTLYATTAEQKRLVREAESLKNSCSVTWRKAASRLG